MLSDFTINNINDEDIFLIIDNNKIINIDDFDKLDNYFTKKKIAKDDYWNNSERYKNCFNFIQTNMNNNFISVKCPSTNNIISTDLYFTITGQDNVLGNNLYCFYYFKSENYMLGFDLGSGLGSMYTNSYSLINFNNNNIYLHLLSINNY